MAYVNYDPNKTDQDNTTNVLSPGTGSGTASTSQPSTSTSEPLSNTSASTYVSNGNPYGTYGSPQSQQPSAGTTSARKSNTGASSGQFTNVQSYVDKNKQSSQNLGTAVAGKLQNTSDIAKQNLQSVENKFQQGKEAGSLENYQGAVKEAQGAYDQAAGQQAATKTWNAKEASMYAPTKTAEGTYSAEDQKLVDANVARALFGDGSYKDYATQADATAAINSYNAANPGYYTYGEEQKLGVSDDRLKDILNAQYQGPNELSEIAGYGDAYNKFQDASTLQNQVLKGGSNEELLNRTFATPQSQYSYGSKLLDDLLLGQGKANETLRSTAQGLGTTASGKLSDEFAGRTKEARGSAAARSQELNQVKEQAREALTNTAAGRSKEVNDRINTVIKDWDKYPQYFRDRFQEELDNNNVAATKKQEYDSYAPQVNQAKENISSMEAKYPGITTFDPSNLNTPEVQALIEQFRMNSEPSATGLDLGGNPIPGYELDRASGLYFPSKELATQQLLATRKESVDQYKNQLAALQPKLDELAQFANYDPNALDVRLSQLEAEALGVKGGEGLYNILKDQGIEGLIKTAEYDKNKLVSEDEQSQLARLQSIAQLANDYGVKGSGVNVTNQFGDRDAAGQQNALSALDADNLKRVLQGAERTFRTDAAGSNITGSGYGQGSSSGLFGKKKAQAWSTLDQNFGDLLAQNDAYRNMYSDEGVNNDLLRQIASGAKGADSFYSGNTDSGVVGGTLDAIGAPADYLSNFLGSGSVPKAASNLGLLTNPVTAPLALANMLGSTLGGSKAAAQGEADLKAREAAVANLQQNITNKINTSGLKNQLSVGQNAAQDMELFKLLGLLDTTNL